MIENRVTGSAVVVFFLVHNCYVCQPANFGLRKPKSVTESCDILIGTSRQLQTERGQCIEPTLMPFDGHCSSSSVSDRFYWFTHIPLLSVVFLIWKACLLFINFLSYKILLSKFHENPFELSWEHGGGVWHDRGGISAACRGDFYSGWKLVTFIPARPENWWLCRPRNLWSRKSLGGVTTIRTVWLYGTVSRQLCDDVCQL